MSLKVGETNKLYTDDRVGPQKRFVIMLSDFLNKVKEEGDQGTDRGQENGTGFI